MARCDLEPDVVVLVKLAALVAVGAGPASYLSNIGAAAATSVTLEDAQNVLVAIAPVVGIARVETAAVHMVEALGIAIAAFEDDDED